MIGRTFRVVFTTLLVISFSICSLAEDLSLSGVEKLIIVSPAGTVNLVGGAGATLRTSSPPQLTWSTRLEGRVLRLIGSASANVPVSAARVDVIGGLPVEIHLSEGNVGGSRWSHPILIDLLKGKVAFKNCKANLNALVQAGQVIMVNHHGPSQLEMYRGSVVAKNYNGDLSLVGLRADLTAEKFHGLLNLNQYQGSNKVTGGRGTLRFNNTKASVLAIKYDGRIEGFSQEGNTAISTIKEPEVRVRTVSGKVSVRATGSGAMVSAVSHEGELHAPSYMRVERSKNARQLRGRLKGAGKGGRIELSAQTGSLILRE